MNKLISIILILIVITSCSEKKIASDFDPIANIKDSDTVFMDFDLSGNVVTEGIVMPSVNQTKDGFFDYKFKFASGKKDKKYFYKIYYQNETYKFDEQDSLSYENFYGSFEDTNIGFMPVEVDEDNFVKGKFRIVGNPREEKIYFGEDISNNAVNQERVNSLINHIKTVPEWFNSIVEKAKENHHTVDEQLYLDAVWMIQKEINTGDINHRWKRNPRTGDYSFMLVICDEQTLKNIPDYIQNINKTNSNGQFVNPYSWFNKSTDIGINILKSRKVLRTKASITPKNGIYVNIKDYKSIDKIDTTCSTCCSSEKLYKKALFQQFFSHISKQYSLRNIPLIQDVIGEKDCYTMAQYNRNKTLFDSSQLIYNYPVTAKNPCKTVKLSDDSSYISIINPGNKDIKELRKESTGIITRVGFTYGKFRGKIKFPPMLNKENIWNGLTYAFWLIYQDEHEWNYRRSSKNGYAKKGDTSENPERAPQTNYSEIDIEIVKSSKFWPLEYYKDTTKKSENAKLSSDIMFCSTNWDLAANDPINFQAGINTINYKGNVFEAMRWTNLYQALTIKTPIPNSIFDEDYYYYEIEWKPKEIIWRVGPSPDKMVVVGYMSDKNTNIPNNQMLTIITQEYHYSEWWPPYAFEQGMIPYNKTDIEGKVFGIAVE